MVWDWGTGTREARRLPGFLGEEHRLWKIKSEWILGLMRRAVNPRRRQFSNPHYIVRRKLMSPFLMG